MKHFLMAALLMTGVATFAQTAVKTETTEITKPKKEKVTPESQTKKLTEELTLTTQQQVKVKALFEQEAKTKAELKELRKNAADDAAKAAVKAKAKENKEAFKAEMKNILTADQFAKWNSFKAKQPGMRTNEAKLKSKADNAKPQVVPTN